MLPKEKRATALQESHDDTQSGYLGVEKTYHQLATLYFWPNMFRDVASYVRHCDPC